MIEITSKEHYKQEVAEGTVVVDVYAPWCGPCKMITPNLEELEQEYTNVKFIKVNADEHKDIAEDLNVMSIPTILVLNDGDLFSKSVGFRPKEVFEEMILQAQEDEDVSE